MNKRLLMLASVLLSLVATCLPSTTALADVRPGDLPAVESLTETRPAPSLPDQQQRQSIPRVWPHQPPVIPHAIRGHQLDSRHNRCLDCHQGSGADLTGATAISPSHYVNREGENLGRLAGARHHCVMCHVPQQPAELLTKSRFGQPPEALKEKEQ